MRINTFFYCVRQGFQNIVRNKLFSLASIGTICASIFLLGLFYSIVVNFSNIVKEAETTVGITIFFEEDVSYDEEKMQEIADEIAQRPEVEKMNFVSADEAWEYFKDEYFDGRTELAEGFAQDNPLAASASYEIYLNNVEDQTSFVQYLEEIPGIRKINYSEMAVRGLTSVNKIISYVSVAIVAVLIFVAVFLITNTIGAFLGYGIYTVLSNVTPQGVCGRFYAAAVYEQKELLLLVVYSFAIMVTVQPVVVSRLFGLG